MAIIAGKLGRFALYTAVAAMLVLAAQRAIRSRASATVLETRIEALPRPEAYQPTAQDDQALSRFLGDVIVFTMLHEVGHLLTSDFQIPVLANPEDGADRFAVMVLSRVPVQADHEPLVSAAQFFEGLPRLGLVQALDLDDEHPAPGQRGHEMRCLAYGTDPVRFGPLAEMGQWDEERRQRCLNDAAVNAREWGKILDTHLSDNPMPLARDDAPVIAVVYAPIPAGLAPDVAVKLAAYRSLLIETKALDILAGQLAQLKMNRDLVSRRRLAMPADALQSLNYMPGVNHPDVTADPRGYDYVVAADACLDKQGQPTANASWSADNRSLVLCYSFVELVANVGKAYLAEEQASRNAR